VTPMRGTTGARRGRRAVAVIGSVAILPLLFASATRADVDTVSGNTLRTGWDASEPTLTPAHVASASVGQLFATDLPMVVGNTESGLQQQQILTQPLVADGYLVVATEENRVYGLNPATGAIRWSRYLGPSWPVATIGCADLVPDIGVTSTPVYDPSNHTLYVLNKTYDGQRSGVRRPRFQLHALNIVNGRERKGWPVTIKGDPTDSPGIPFNPERQLQRPGLLLLDGVIYAGFAAHCNPLQYGPTGDVDGYVAGISASRHRLTTLWSTEAGYASAGGGVWQSGGGLTSDGPGSIFVATGNGLIAAPVGPGDRPAGTLADGVVHLRVQPNGSLKPVDFFGPTDNTQLNRADTDVASSGPLLIPAGYGTRKYPDLLVQNGKDGLVWLLNRKNLGGVGQGKGHGNAVLGVTGPFNGVWGYPAFFGAGKGYIYYVPFLGPMYALKLGSSRGVPRLTLAGESAVPGAFGFSSGSPAVTSTGKSPGSGLVWVVYATSATGAFGTLNAYDAIPVNGVLKMVRSWPIGTVSAFGKVATDDGRVYVANRLGQVLGFGTISARQGAPLGGTAIDFGSVPVGTTATRNVTLLANRTVTITSISVLPPFAIAGAGPTIPVTLKAGERLIVPVTFQPQPAEAPGQWSYVFVGIEGSHLSPVPVEVFGTGATPPAFTTSDPALSFGSEPTGTTSVQSVLITNTGASAEKITSQILPPAASGFQIQGLPAVGSVLEPATSATVTVTYAPSRTGPVNDSVGVRAGSISATVLLTATATTGSRHLSIFTSPLNFGRVRVGHSATRTFDLEVTGTDNLSVWTSRLPSGPFRAEHPLASGSGLYPLSVVPVTVVFRPTRKGQFRGVYVFDARDGQGRQIVRLIGTGVG
jgi:outer membrane protein assembly factor BamB